MYRGKHGRSGLSEGERILDTSALAEHSHATYHYLSILGDKQKYKPTTA